MAGREGVPVLGGSDHAVRSYGRDEELAASVADYLSGALAVSGSMVVVPTEARRKALDAGLAGRGVDVCARSPFSLLGGYPGGLVAGEESTAELGEVCQLHTGVQRERGFPYVRDSVREARHFVLGVVEPRYDQGVADDAAIVATELAANAVLHAGSAFTVGVRCSPDGVRISVRDHGALARAPLAGAPAAGGPLEDGMPIPVPPGHGLSVVAQLADSWAVEALPDGKIVWAQLPVTPDGTR